MLVHLIQNFPEEQMKYLNILKKNSSNDEIVSEIQTSQISPTIFFGGGKGDLYQFIAEYI